MITEITEMDRFIICCGTILVRQNIKTGNYIFVPVIQKEENSDD